MTTSYASEMLDGFAVTAERDGVTLRARGTGTPVYVIPGMEGSGESCLHLALPVLRTTEAAHRIVLVDYARERHDTMDALVRTIHASIAADAGASPCVLWAQSFGNLLATGAAARGRLSVKKLVLVSPFTALPSLITEVGPPLLAITPGVLYRYTAKPFGRYLFGPAGDQRDHAFFEALRQTPLGDVRRRTAWLRGRDYAPRYEQVEAPAHVWLGTRDRLIDLDAQRRFFQDLSTRKPNYHLSMLAGSGHVMLPSSVITTARNELAAWLVSA